MRNSVSGHSSLRRDTTQRVCARARVLPRVPTVTIRITLVVYRHPALHWPPWLFSRLCCTSARQTPWPMPGCRKPPGCPSRRGPAAGSEWGTAALAVQGSSKVTARLAKAMEAGVTVQLCHNALVAQGMESEGAALPSGMQVVPAGVVALAEAQAEGWAYIRV
ncbi:DsrE family protein [Deinococcus lacus]|uniref:DsrE family protein n=1 Tax=Deinococcus lacus TaxID=392561 RepID=UPI0036D3FEA0